MDKTIKQIIKENHANGVKNIYWSEKQWVIEYIGKGLTPHFCNNFSEVMKSIKPTKSH